jgi:hypothetical protein
MNYLCAESELFMLLSHFLKPKLIIFDHINTNHNLYLKPYSLGSPCPRPHDLSTVQYSHPEVLPYEQIHPYPNGDIETKTKLPKLCLQCPLLQRARSSADHSSLVYKPPE